MPWYIILFLVVLIVVQIIFLYVYVKSKNTTISGNFENTLKTLNDTLIITKETFDNKLIASIKLQTEILNAEIKRMEKEHEKRMQEIQIEQAAMFKELVDNPDRAGEWIDKYIKGTIK